MKLVIFSGQWAGNIKLVFFHGHLAGNMKLVTFAVMFFLALSGKYKIGNFCSNGFLGNGWKI